MSKSTTVVYNIINQHLDNNSIVRLEYNLNSKLHFYLTIRNYPFLSAPFLTNTTTNLNLPSSKFYLPIIMITLG